MPFFRSTRIKAAVPNNTVGSPERARPGFYIEAAMAHVSEAVITADGFGRITFMNRAAQSLTVRALLDVAGAPLSRVFSLVHPDTGEPVEATVDLSEPSEDNAHAFHHAVLLTAANRTVVIEYRATALRDEHGAFTGTVIGFRDIARRRAAELALQASEEAILANAEALYEERERAQVTLNAIGDAVISCDFRGRVNFINIVAEKMTGWTQAEASGRVLDEIFSLVDERTRVRVPCPTMQAIIENRRVGIDTPTVLIRRDGSEIAVEDSASPIHDKNGGVIGAVMVAHDVTVARDLSVKLARLALHDSLTDLPNRALFADRLDQALVRADRTRTSVALLFIDLDQFKPVNDSLGHAFGDRLLQAVAERLLNCVRTSDTVSRFGGDEFLVLLADLVPGQELSLCTEKMLCALNAPYEIDDHKLLVTASIGVARYPEDAPDAKTLIKYADAAMYEAKSSGRNRCQLFTREMKSSSAKKSNPVGVPS